MVALKVAEPAEPIAGVTVTAELVAPALAGVKVMGPIVHVAPEESVSFAVQVPEEPNTKRVELVSEASVLPSWIGPPVAVTVKEPQAIGEPTVVTGQARLVVGVSTAVPMPPMVPEALTTLFVPPSVRETVSVVDSVPAVEDVGAKVMVPVVQV